MHSFMSWTHNFVEQQIDFVIADLTRGYQDQIGSRLYVSLISMTILTTITSVTLLSLVHWHYSLPV